MNPDGIEKLKIAIVRQAARDYLEALRVMRRYTAQSYYCRRAEYMAAKCETFFTKDIDYFVSIDGIKLMETIRERSYDPDFWVKMED